MRDFLFQRLAGRFNIKSGITYNQISDIQYMEPSSEKVRYLNGFIQEVAKIMDKVEADIEYGSQEEKQEAVNELEAMIDNIQSLPEVFGIVIDSMKSK